MQQLKTAGSSPRVRGTGPRPPGRRLIARFIPACAGNRAAAPARSQTPSVHPRVCGEQCRSSIFFVRPAGSSPRVRGTGRSSWPHGTGGTVHPRVCGEQSRDRRHVQPTVGSSPRVRGTVFAQTVDLTSFSQFPGTYRLQRPSRLSYPDKSLPT